MLYSTHSKPPMGLPHHIVQLFMEASCVFRNYDRDFSGTLEFHEFQNAMFHLGYRVYVRIDYPSAMKRMEWNSLVGLTC